jgi:hypothetical protein
MAEQGAAGYLDGGSMPKEAPPPVQPPTPRHEPGRSCGAPSPPPSSRCSCTGSNTSRWGAPSTGQAATCILCGERLGWPAGESSELGAISPRPGFDPVAPLRPITPNAVTPTIWLIVQAPARPAPCPICSLPALLQDGRLVFGPIYWFRRRTGARPLLWLGESLTTIIVGIKGQVGRGTDVQPTCQRRLKGQFEMRGAAGRRAPRTGGGAPGKPGTVSDAPQPLCPHTPPDRAHPDPHPGVGAVGRHRAARHRPLHRHGPRRRRAAWRRVGRSASHAMLTGEPPPSPPPNPHPTTKPPHAPLRARAQAWTPAACRRWCSCWARC